MAERSSILRQLSQDISQDPPPLAPARSATLPAVYITQAVQSGNNPQRSATWDVGWVCSTGPVCRLTTERKSFEADRGKLTLRRLGTTRSKALALALHRVPYTVHIASSTLRRGSTDRRMLPRSGLSTQDTRHPWRIALQIIRARPVGNHRVTMGSASLIRHPMAGFSHGQHAKTSAWDCNLSSVFSDQYVLSCS